MVGAYVWGDRSIYILFMVWAFAPGGMALNMAKSMLEYRSLEHGKGKRNNRTSVLTVGY